MALPMVFDALLSTRNGYLKKEVVRTNRGKEFAISNKKISSEFINDCGSSDLLISGSDGGERAIAVIEYIKKLYRYIPIVILHKGNYSLSVDSLRAVGLNATQWNLDPLQGLTKAQCLSILTRETDSYQGDLTVFYSFALDVLTALNMDYSLTNLAGIDWTSTFWMEQVRQNCDKYISFDLFSRYDTSMAARAAKATVVLERISRQINCSKGDNQFMSRDLSVLQINSSSSQYAEQVYELFNEAFERNLCFCLILDDVYKESLPFIEEPSRNMRLVLSNNDISYLNSDIGKITNREHAIILFKQDKARSSEKISEYYFGSYNHYINERSSSVHKQTFDILGRSTDYSISYRRSRDLRLDPSEMSKLPYGSAVAYSRGTGECIVNFLEREWR